MFLHKSKIERILSHFQWLFAIENTWDTHSEVVITRIKEHQLRRWVLADIDTMWWVHGENHTPDFDSISAFPLLSQDSSLGAAIVDTLAQKGPYIIPLHVVARVDDGGKIAYIIYRPPSGMSLNEACQKNLWRK